MDKTKKSIGYKVSIFDPTSIHGKEMKKVLIERGFPYESVKLIDIEEKLGTVAEFDDEATIVTLADTEALTESDVIFFCGNPKASAAITKRYKELDFFAFDLSRSQNESENYKYFVSPQDREILRKWNGIYATPHPVAVPLIRTLSKLEEEFGLLFASATAMNAVSEIGFEGISSLHKQTTDLMNFVPLDEKQRIFNLFPRQTGYADEIGQIRRHVTDSEKLKNLEFTLSLIDVPIFFGAAIVVYVEMESSSSKDFAWNKLFTGDDGFKFDGNVSAGDDPLGPVDIAETDLLHVQLLNIEEDNSKLWFWILADNIRLCSVINIVQLAEAVLGLDENR